MKKYSILKYLLPSIILILIINILCCVIDYSFGISMQIFADLADKKDFVTNLFLVEVQITFIVLSLATVLSTQTKQVYWEDMFQYRLIKPRFWNFTAITSYILATFIDGVILMIADKCMGGFYCTMGIISSFLITLILMSILSVRMIGANFGREELKKELEDELTKTIKSTQKIDEHIGFDRGLRIPQIRQLTQVTIQELEEKKLDLACENMDLLYRFGFYHTLKRCYDYAIECSSSKSIMHEVNYSLMHKALEDNETGFFYGIECPIPFEAQAKLWNDIIYDEFDKAAVLFMNGKKNEAFSIRLKLYKTLLGTFNYYWPDIDSDDEETKYRIINLMAFFVDRRTENIQFQIGGEFISLGEDWKTNEREMKDFDLDIEEYEFFLEDVENTIDRWNKSGKEFICDTLYLNMRHLSLAKDF